MFSKILVPICLITLIYARDFNFAIVHTNDLVGNYDSSNNRWHCVNQSCEGGFARLSYVLKLFRKQARDADIPLLYLDAGNSVAGSAWFSFFGFDLAAQLMNILSPDAVAIGEFEFYNGDVAFAEYLSKVTFPILSVNIDITKSNHFVNKSIARSIIKQCGDVKVGIVGYSDPAIMMKAALANVTFNDLEFSLQREVKCLKKKNVDIIIALGQAGIWRDKELASRIADVDIVIGGNSRTFLHTDPAKSRQYNSTEIMGPYPIVIIQKSGKYVPVVQAFTFCKYFGILRVKFDKIRNKLTYSGNTFKLHDYIPQDENITSILKTKIPLMEREKANIIGYSKVQLECFLCEMIECNIGNLATDAMVEYYAQRYYGPFWTDAPVALLTGAAFRRCLLGNEMPMRITEEDIKSLMLDLKIVRCDIYGDHLLEALDSAIYAVLNNTGKFIQYSGLRMECNMYGEAPPFITDVKIRCSKCYEPDYFPLNPKSVYTILLNELKLITESSFFVLQKYIFDCIPLEDLMPNASVGTVVKDYIQRRRTVYPITGDRFFIPLDTNSSQEHWLLDVAGNKKI